MSAAAADAAVAAGAAATAGGARAARAGRGEAGVGAGCVVVTWPSPPPASWVSGCVARADCAAFALLVGVGSCALRALSAAAALCCEAAAWSRGASALAAEPALGAACGWPVDAVAASALGGGGALSASAAAGAAGGGSGFFGAPSPPSFGRTSPRGKARGLAAKARAHMRFSAAQMHAHHALHPAPTPRTTHPTRIAALHQAPTSLAARTTHAKMQATGNADGVLPSICTSARAARPRARAGLAPGAPLIPQRLDQSPSCPPCLVRGFQWIHSTSRRDCRPLEEGGSSSQPAWAAMSRKAGAAATPAAGGAALACGNAECGKALAPPLLQCSKCKGEAYCCKACQVPCPHAREARGARTDPPPPCPSAAARLPRGRPGTSTSAVRPGRARRRHSCGAPRRGARDQRPRARRRG